MQRHRSALLLAAGAALITSGTTFLLWYLPRQYAAPTTFEETLALHENGAYMARLWINFIHVFLALAAYGAAAFVMRAKAPAAAAVGFVAFCFWSLAEALGLAINIWGVNGMWRAGYAAADPEAQALIRASLHTFRGVWEGVFFVVLTAFLIGTLSMGVALFRGDALQRILGALFLLAAPLTVIIMLDGYFGASLSQWISWSYPVLQPVSRALLGVWLIRVALSAEPKGA